MAVKEKVHENLVVLDRKKDHSVKVVTGVDAKGNMLTADPTNKPNPDFLKIDKSGNVLENFFSNLSRQYKDPTRFDFFKIIPDALNNFISDLKKNAPQLEPKEFDTIYGNYYVFPEDFDKNNQKQTYTPIDESRINWDKLGQLGITRKLLEDTGSLEPMLNYKKSPGFIRVNGKLDGIRLNEDARLSFFATPDGKLELNIHGIKNEIDLKTPFYGHTFTPEEQTNLLETGNLGKVINLKIPSTNGNDTFRAYISVDKLTKELVAFRADRIIIPNNIKGVALDPTQQKCLEDGAGLYLEKMISKYGNEFSATLQVNAEKQGLEFIFDKNAKKQEQKAEQKFRIPSIIGKVKIDDKQYKALENGNAIYLQNMVNSDGVLFNSYVKVNHEKQKLDYHKFNPDKKQEIKQEKSQSTKPKGIRL